MNGNVGMHHAKNSGNKKLIPVSSKLAQSCVTPPYMHTFVYSGKGVTHDCASIVDNIAKGTPLFFAWCIPTSPLNDFYTCINVV